MGRGVGTNITAVCDSEFSFNPWGGETLVGLASLSTSNEKKITRNYKLNNETFTPFFVNNADKSSSFSTGIISEIFIRVGMTCKELWFFHN